MPYEYDGKGAEMPSDGFTIPDDEYVLKINDVKEGTSKKGDYQVTLHLKVVGGEHDGFDVKFHRVTFLKPSENPKAAGMSLHFLKTIGQPWEGKPVITPQNWKGKQLKAYLAADDYGGFKSMKIKWVAPLDVEAEMAQAPEEVPF